jgi:hypothetical protein
MAAPPSVRTETTPRLCAGDPLPSARSRLVSSVTARSEPVAPDSHEGEAPKEPAMKQRRCGVVSLVALLMIASLAHAPCEGSTRLVDRQLLPGDPRPTQEMGSPDTPPHPGPRASCRVWLSSILLARGIRVDVAMVRGIPKCPAGARSARCTLRPTVRP